MQEKRLEDSYSEVLCSEFGAVSTKPSAFPLTASTTVGKSLLCFYFCTRKRNLHCHFVTSFKHNWYIRVCFYLVGAKPDWSLWHSFETIGIHKIIWMHVRCYIFKETATVRVLALLMVCSTYWLLIMGLNIVAGIPCLYFYLNWAYSSSQVNSPPGFLLMEESPVSPGIFIVTFSSCLSRTQMLPELPGWSSQWDLDWGQEEAPAHVSLKWHSTSQGSSQTTLAGVHELLVQGKGPTARLSEWWREGTHIFLQLTPSTGFIFHIATLETKKISEIKSVFTQKSPAESVVCVSGL